MSSANGDVKVRVEELYKIFGDNPTGEALSLAQEGTPKPDVLEKTGHVLALADVNFSVNRGELFVVMGLSGSGKSTLIRCINRLIESTSGHIYVDGEDVLRYNKHQLQNFRRTKIAMVFQHFALFPHQTVAENTAYGLKVQGVNEQTRREKALETLELVGLGGWGDHYPHNLSGGMQQRVGLARALAVDPEIMLMDEPFGALDPLIRREMHKELLSLQETLQKTIIFITHDLNEATKIGDRIAVMRGGRIVQIATPQEIILNPADDYVADFTRDLDPSNVLTAGTIMKPAATLRLGHDSLDTAQEQLQSADDDTIFRRSFFVVNAERKPVGILLEQDIVRAIDAGTTELSAAMRETFPQTGTDTPLEVVSDFCMQGLPVAVVGDDGRLQGEARPVDVLANFGREKESGERATHISEGSMAVTDTQRAAAQVEV